MHEYVLHTNIDADDRILYAVSVVDLDARILYAVGVVRPIYTVTGCVHNESIKSQDNYVNFIYL